MRLQNRALGFVVNFLLGVAWASALLGAVTSFLIFYHDNFFWAIVSAFMGALPGMVGVLLLEHIITGKENQLELQKQTALLEKLLMQKENNNPQ
ncbi:hypothetical protein [Sulfurovum sp.]|uniref:hypothetical protein n=1 Tax=Sulfurovum sp. TaxID=1969726 RepID=UPI002867D642|nr:hypothetical protein [Sulfurovum sp.]